MRRFPLFNLPAFLLMGCCRAWLTNQQLQTARLGKLTFVACAMLATGLLTPDSLGQLERLRRSNRYRPTVFTGFSRQLLRPFRLAESAIKNGDYDRACNLLGALISDDDTKDCLVPDEKEWGYAISLRQKSLDLLGQMDDQQRKVYTEKYSTRARQRLDKAIEARDYQSIQVIADRFLFTDAGLEANMLLGHHRLSNGQTQLSADLFETVLNIPRGRQLYNPELRLSAAICNLLSNRPEKAQQHLIELKKNAHPNATFYQTPIFDDSQDPIQWLVSLVGSSPLKSQSTVKRWLMWQGNPERNAETIPGFPLMSPIWNTDILGDSETSNRLKASLDLMAKNQVPPVPKTNLVTAGDFLVVKTAQAMIGIDAQTGKRSWSFPAEDPALLGRYQTSNTRANQRADFNLKRKQSKFYERTLLDSIYSQISSDGKFVFCIPNPGIATTRMDWQRYRRNQFEKPTDLKRSNTLCAVDSASQGQLVWEVGGQTGGDEPKLANVFFLGAPLPLDDQLYCIARENQLVKLFVLDAATGQLLWQKELASAEEGIKLSDDAVRRLAGATPAASDGILVCPTTLNAIVAVDIATRSLKWGFQFGTPRTISYSRFGTDKYWQSYSRQWRDTTLKITDGAVVYAPIDSKDLHCVNLRTGRPRWGANGRAYPQKRDKAMYVATINNGHIVLVTPTELRGIHLVNRKVEWTIQFDSYGAPSGRGYVSGNSFYMPTTSKKILRFDLEQHAISQVVDTQRVLGNLFPQSSEIISVGLDHVAAYHCDQVAERVLNLGLADAADDSDTATTAPSNDLVPHRWSPHARLAIKAQLDLQRGNHLRAARHIAEAYDLFPNSSYGNVLVEALNKLILTDFKQAQQMHQRYAHLFHEGQLERLLRGKVYGLRKTNQLEEAFETLLMMAAQNHSTTDDNSVPGGPISDTDLIKIKSDQIDQETPQLNKEKLTAIEMTRSAWVRWQLADLTEQLTASPDTGAQTKQRLSKLVNDHLAGLVDKDAFERDVIACFNRLRFVPGKLVDPKTFVQAAGALYAQGHRIESRSLISPESSAFVDWENSPVEVRYARLGLLGRLAIDDQDFKSAQMIIQDVIDAQKNHPAKKEWLSKITADLQTKSQELRDSLTDGAFDHELYLKLADQSSAFAGPRYRLPDVQWMSDVSEIEEQDRPSFVSILHDCIVYESDVAGFETLKFSFEASIGKLQVRDRLGRVVGTIYLHPDGDGPQLSPSTKGKVFLKDSVMLLNIGKEIFAIDWTNFVMGKRAQLWRIELQKGTFSRNVFGGPRAQGICFLDGADLKCIDLFTGKTQWVRRQLPTSSMVKEGDSRITIWNHNQMKGQVFDKLCGARLAGGKVARLSKLSSPKLAGYNNFHLFQTPIRGSADGTEEADPFSDKPYTWLKLQLVDFNRREIVWEKDYPFPTAICQVDQRHFAVVTEQGELSLIDMTTGEQQFTQTLTGIGDLMLSSISVTTLAERYIFCLNTSDRRKQQATSLDDTTVRFSNFNDRNRLKTGYLVAVDSKSGDLVWDKPLRMESFAVLDPTPFDSPLLMLLRRANYRLTRGSYRDLRQNQTRVQLAMLDVGTGAIKNNQLLEVLVTKEPHCQLLCCPMGAADKGSEKKIAQQTLELSIAEKHYVINLSANPDADLAVAANLKNEATTLPLKKQVEEVDPVQDGSERLDLIRLESQAERAWKKTVELQKQEAEMFDKMRQTQIQKK